MLADGRIQTIEGNTNPGNGQDGVYRMRRSPKYIKGYCRPFGLGAAAIKDADRISVGQRLRLR